MLAKRQLREVPSHLLLQPILRLQDIDDFVLAGRVIEDARLEAHDLVAKLQAQAEAKHEQSLTEFWLAANEVLRVLSDQQSAFRQAGLSSLELILQSALCKLLDEAGLAERIRSLVRHLDACQPTAHVALLFCNPCHCEPLSAWLASSRFHKLWQLQLDELMPDDALRLRYPGGDFDLDWNTFRRALIRQCDSDSSNHPNVELS